MPAAVTTLPATTGAAGATAADRLDRLQRLLLVAVRGVDDEHVDARVEQRLALAATSPLMPDGGGDPQPPAASMAGR